MLCALRSRGLLPGQCCLTMSEGADQPVGALPLTALTCVVFCMVLTACRVCCVWRCLLRGACSP